MRSRVQLRVARAEEEGWLADAPQDGVTGAPSEATKVPTVVLLCTDNDVENFKAGIHLFERSRAKDGRAYV